MHTDANLLKIILGSPRPSGPLAPGPRATEVIAEPFPLNRCIRWMPENLSGIDPPFSLVVTQDVLSAVCRHVAEDLSREFGGFLLGNRYVCPQSACEYVLIDNYYEAGFTEGDATSLLFSTDTWADLTDKLHTRFRGKALVGWYHSHPRMGVYLSERDAEVHHSRFPEAWTCALVLEPEKGHGGFFVYEAGRLNRTQPVEFYEYFDHLSAESVVFWTNHLPDCPEYEEAPVEDQPVEIPIEANQASAQIVPVIHSGASSVKSSSWQWWKYAAAGLAVLLAGGLGMFLGAGGDRLLRVALEDGSRQVSLPTATLPTPPPPPGTRNVEVAPVALEKEKETGGQAEKKKKQPDRKKKGGSPPAAQVITPIPVSGETGRSEPDPAANQPAAPGQNQKPVAGADKEVTTPTPTPAAPAKPAQGEQKKEAHNNA